MADCGREYIVTAEKMLFSTEALARIEGFPVFVENACPEDVIRIKITKKNKNYAKAELVEVKTPSKFRVKPFCPLANVCGSCSWQHISYDEQLRQKQNIVKETLKKIAGIDVDVPETIPSPVQTEYRCKIQYPLQQTKVSKRILAGYYKKNSHELVNIKFCPVHSDIINKITEFFRTRAADFEVYSEKTHKGLLRHIVFKYSKVNNEMLIVLCVNDDKVSLNLKALCEDIYNTFSEVKGVCVNFNTMHNNVIMSDKTKTVAGQGFYYEQIGDKKFKISANSFFQVNPYTAQKIFEYVKNEIKKRVSEPTVLDAYSGVSTFGIMLSDVAKEVVCVEEVKHAVEDAKENVVLNGCKNVEVIGNDAGKEFDRFQREGKQFDVVLVDPPRKGCSEESIQNVVRSAKKFIVYVSCDVSTLARDMKYILNNGFKLLSVQPFDMFPNTYHIENVVLMVRE